MNRTIMLLALCTVALTTCAAKNATVKAEYTESYVNWTGSNIRNVFLLLANNTESRYYNPMTQVVDSMLSTAEGTRQFNEMVMAAVDAGQRPALLPKSRDIVIKSRDKGDMLCLEEAAGVLGNYRERMDEQQWTLTDSAKMILGYECQMAEMDYHGRHWKAWFAMDIPLQDGPWKLCGLPGLILEADADNGRYHFEATGIEAVDQPFPAKIYGHDLSESIKRKDLRATTWKFYLTSGAQMAADYGITGISEVELPEGFDLIETDYK